MGSELFEIEAERVLVLDAEGSPVRDAGGGRDLVEEAMNRRASVIAVPVARLDSSFFELRSGLAGEVIQKVLNYHCKFAVVGDISMHVAASDALRDFVVECSRGRDIFFVDDLGMLMERLAEVKPRTE